MRIAVLLSAWILGVWGANPAWADADQKQADKKKEEKEDDKKKAEADLKKMAGGWKIERMVMGGMEMPGEQTKGLSVNIDEKTKTLGLISPMGTKRVVLDLTATADPKLVQITMVGGPFNGEQGSGIYKFDAKKLHMVLPNGKGTEIPKKFESPKGSRLMYLVLVRPKKGKEEEKKE